MKTKRGIFLALREMPQQSCYFSCASRDRYSSTFSSRSLRVIAEERGSTALWIFQLRRISRKFSQTRFASDSHALHYRDMTHGNFVWYVRATSFFTLHLLYVWCIISYFFIPEIEYIKIREHINESVNIMRLSLEKSAVRYWCMQCDTCFILFNLHRYYIFTALYHITHYYYKPLIIKNAK